MNVRPLGKKDLPDALFLVREVFMEFEAPVYSQAGVRAFLSFISYDSILERFENGQLQFWGCFEAQIPIGVLAIRDGSHICLLFVKKNRHRQGVARRLFGALLQHCGGKVREITVNSSPYAVEAYRHLGFIATGSEQTLNGIRFTPMAYRF